MEEKKFASPKSGEFKKYWDLLIDNVTGRDNFTKGHLFQLSVLCDLYVEYDHLTEKVKEEGYIYETSGRHGDLIKVNPHVTMRQKTLAELRSYSKLLGLTLFKDGPSVPEEEEDEWL